MTQPPAGWYIDRETPTQQRYWDGQGWTAHVQPLPPPVHAPYPAPLTAPRRKLSTGAVVAIVLSAIAAFVLVILVLAAIAIPVFLNQREKAEDHLAESDARTVAIEVLYYFVDYQSYPDVTFDGSTYVVSGPDGEYSRMEATPGVTLEEYVVHGDDFCVATVAANGSDAGVHYVYSTGEVFPGRC